MIGSNLFKNKTLNYFENNPKIIYPIGVILLLLVAFIDSDYLTGELSLSILYLIPISLYAWYLGLISTVIITIACTVAEIYVNKVILNHHFVIINGITKFLFFLVTAMIIIKLKDVFSDMKKMVIQLEVSLNKEKEVNFLKSSFISTVSHEFRTPLATIMATNSIIKNYSKKMSEEEIISQHEIVEEQLHDLTKMLDDFVVIGKIENDKLDINNEETNIKNLSEHIIQELKTINSSNDRIKFSYTGHEIFFCDKRIIRQIVLNLLTNALKYSVKPVNFNIINSISTLLITIEDNGIGIPKEDKKRVFEQFYRAANVNTIPGTGLGLSIIKKTIDLCKGKIDFTSEENKGTKFMITIPDSREIK